MSEAFFRFVVCAVTVALSLNQPAGPVVREHLQTQTYNEVPQPGVSSDSSLPGSTRPAAGIQESASTQHQVPSGNPPPVLQHPMQPSDSAPDSHRYQNPSNVYGSKAPNPPGSPVTANLGSFVPSVVYQLPLSPPASLPFIHPSAHWSQQQPAPSHVQPPVILYPPQSFLPSPQNPYSSTFSLPSPHPQTPHVIYVLSHPPQPANYPSFSPATSHQPQAFRPGNSQSSPNQWLIQTYSPSYVTHQPFYLSPEMTPFSHSSKDISYTPYIPQALHSLPLPAQLVPPSTQSQSPRYAVVQVHSGSGGGIPGNERFFGLSQHEAGIGQVEWNGSSGSDPLSAAAVETRHAFPGAAQHGSPLQVSSLSRLTDGQRQNQSSAARPAVAYSDVGAAASPVFQAAAAASTRHNASSSDRYVVAAPARPRPNAISTLSPAFIDAAAAGSRHNVSLAASPGHHVSTTFNAEVATSLGSNNSHAANPPRLGLALPAGGVSRSLASLLLAPRIYSAAQTLAADVELVQYYEAHGCVDPGASLMGLAFGCWAPQSQLLCQTIGQRLTNGRSPVTHLMAPQAGSGLLEACLSQSTISRLLMTTSSRQNATTDPLLMMAMIAGTEEAMLQALALMNVLGSNSATSGPGGSKSRPTAGARVAATSRTPTSAGQGQGPEPASDLTSQCRDLLLLLTMRTGAMPTSPEAMEAVTEVRRQLLPFQCQEMTAGRVPFRMCCPGRGKDGLTERVTLRNKGRHLGTSYSADVNVVWLCAFKRDQKVAEGNHRCCQSV